MIKPGRYRHYKGGIYQVMFTALDTKVDKPVVVYSNESHGTYYVRPLEEFTSKVIDAKGIEVPRFLLLEQHD